MKKTILIVCILVLSLTAELYYLSKRNKYLINQNNQIHLEIKENNLIIDNGIVSLESIKKENKNIKIEIGKLLESQGTDDITKILDKKTLTTTSLKEEIASLEGTVKETESKLSNLEEKYNTLLKKQKQEKVYIEGVPTINQNPDYPTGCESVALTILLKYYGVAVTPADIIAHLNTGELPYTENEVTYGGNPELEFVGNPFTQNSFGVYEKPIAEVANMYKEGIIDATGADFETILEFVKNGKPVMVWTSINLLAPYISKSWIYKPTGETIYWKAQEHAVVIIGYTKDKVIISDPYGGEVKYQSRNIFKERYNYFGKKALYY